MFKLISSHPNIQLAASILLLVFTICRESWNSYLMFIMVALQSETLILLAVPYVSLGTFGHFIFQRLKDLAFYTEEAIDFQSQILRSYESIAREGN